ncbi:MAG: hypothetical protein AB7N65_31605, partial [Vicinamibacterales bacterium]
GRRRAMVANRRIQFLSDDDGTASRPSSAQSRAGTTWSARIGWEVVTGIEGKLTLEALSGDERASEG